MLVCSVPNASSEDDDNRVYSSITQPRVRYGRVVEHICNSRGALSGGMCWFACAIDILLRRL